MLTYVNVINYRKPSQRKMMASEQNESSQKIPKEQSVVKHTAKPAPRINAESTASKMATNITLYFPSANTAAIKHSSGPPMENTHVTGESNHLTLLTRGLDDEKSSAEKQARALQHGKAVNVQKHQLMLKLPTVGSEPVGKSPESKLVVKKSQQKSVEEIKLPRLSEIPGQQRRRSAARHRKALTATPNTPDISQLLDNVRSGISSQIQQQRSQFPHPTHPLPAALTTTAYLLPTHTSTAIKQGRLQSAQGRRRTPRQSNTTINSTCLDPSTIVKPYSQAGSRGLKGAGLKSDKSLGLLQETVDQHFIIKPEAQMISMYSTFRARFQHEKKALPTKAAFPQPKLHLAPSTSITRVHTNLKSLAYPIDQSGSIVGKGFQDLINVERQQENVGVESALIPEAPHKMLSPNTIAKESKSTEEETSNTDKSKINRGEIEDLPPQICPPEDSKLLPEDDRDEIVDLPQQILPPEDSEFLSEDEEDEIADLPQQTLPAEESNVLPVEREKRRKILRQASTITAMTESSSKDDSYLIQYDLGDKKKQAMVHKFRGKLN